MSHVKARAMSSTKISVCFSTMLEGVMPRSWFSGGEAAGRSGTVQATPVPMLSMRCSSSRKAVAYSSSLSRSLRLSLTLSEVMSPSTVSSTLLCSALRRSASASPISVVAEKPMNMRSKSARGS
jgi:hypothetical protein